MKKKKDNIAFQKFKKGDHVRIHQPSDKFKSVNWSKDIYIIEKVFKPSNDYSVFEYKLIDTIGRYMTEDLLLVNYPIMNQYDQPKFFRISKLMEAITKDNEPAYIVRWIGHKQKTVEMRKHLMEDVPKNGAIERLNQTLKWLIQKNIQMDLKFDWVKNLPKLVKNINTTFHAE